VTPRTRLIFVCSPNNPTGNQIPEADLLRLLELGIPLFYDEAYFELEDQVHSRVGLIEKYPHMLVNRTFSKAYGLAGFRVGYVLCNPAMASYFNRVRIPWNVSLPAMAAALAELEDREDQEVKRRNTLEGRQYITEQINSLPGLHAYPSEGNFVLIDASALGKSSAEMKDAMTERGIFIRPMSGHNMPRGFIRITVGTPEQNQLFIQTFKAYIQSISGQETQ
jgi:histidinol-phosphate aminotransferase